ncbi:MAG: PTS lactose/cellobiose transporter subunit IIA [Eubacteriales bacterium]|nr:PTS lactose/cellobiose transporter subunit IIA [Eubacteriales bacterium]
MNDELIQIAMDIILKAGDCRNKCMEALKKAKTGDLIAADNVLAEARQDIIKAHQAQTEVIQATVAGEKPLEYSLIFSHAQDTMMTIMSEYNLTKELLDVYRILFKED